MSCVLLHSVLNKCINSLYLFWESKLTRKFPKKRREKISELISFLNWPSHQSPDLFYFFNRFFINIRSFVLRSGLLHFKLEIDFVKTKFPTLFLVKKILWISKTLSSEFCWKQNNNLIILVTFVIIVMVTHNKYQYFSRANYK